MDGNQRASRCVGGLCWVCASVCVETGVCRWGILNSHLISGENSNNRERHSCSDRVYLYEERCWEEGERALLCTCEVGQWSAINQKSKQRHDTGYSELYTQLQHLPMPHKPPGFIVPSRVKVTRLRRDISAHLLCRAVSARLFGWWMCISLITLFCLLIKRPRYFQNWQKQSDVLS